MKYRLTNQVYFSTIPSDIKNRLGKIVYSVADKQFHPENFGFSLGFEIPDKPTYIIVSPEAYLEIKEWFYEAKTCNCSNAGRIRKNVYRLDKTVAD